jgi:hypothetical protein
LVNCIILKEFCGLHSKRFNFYFFKSEGLHEKHAHWELVNHLAFSWRQRKTRTTSTGRLAVGSSNTYPLLAGSSVSRGYGSPPKVSLPYVLLLYW